MKLHKDKLPIRSFVRIEHENTAVYERPLTPKEIINAKLVEHDDSHVRPLTRYRLAKGYTQYELAEVTGVPRNAIQRYETKGIGSCTMYHAAKLAKALDIIVQDLVEPYDDLKDF